MNFPESCTALSLLWVLQWFLLAEVLLSGTGLGRPWWAFLCQNPRAPSSRSLGLAWPPPPVTC